ncbi:MAG: CobW family GTP-binding protein [Promethearchaeota archaeon]
MDRIGLVLITGFFGAGKTTFLKNILHKWSNYKIGVVVNEFGDINVDGERIESEGGFQLIRINDGSIFCSCKQWELVDGLVNLKDHDLSVIFIECSGFADPSPFKNTFGIVNDLTKNAYMYLGSVCLVDALNFLEESISFEAVRRQVEYADLIIINKIDLVGDQEVQGVVNSVRVINPNAELMITTFGQVTYVDLFNKLKCENEFKIKRKSLNTPETRLSKLLLRHKKPVNKSSLLRFLSMISNKALRIKGFCRLEDGWYDVDVVKNIINLERANVSRKYSELVVILDPKIPALKDIEDAWCSITSISKNLLDN